MILQFYIFFLMILQFYILSVHNRLTETCMGLKKWKPKAFQPSIQQGTKFIKTSLHKQEGPTGMLHRCSSRKQKKAIRYKGKG
uniref:Uncharacterized protein n=1 Tax=Arundo donax TaxID=35708 RepID=A0A0A9EJX4_ARUDO